MKRPLLLLLFLSSLVLYLYQTGHLFLLHPQQKQEHYGKIPPKATQLPQKSSPVASARRLSSTDDGAIMLTMRLKKQIERRVKLHFQSMAPQELIPRHAMVVLELSDAAATGKNFLDSRFGQTLININWPVVLQRLKIKTRFRRLLEENSSGLLYLLTHPSFSQVFGRRLFLAQLPGLPSLVQDKKQHPLLDNLLIIMDLGQENPKTVLPVLLDLLRGKKTTRKYNGFTIHSSRADRSQQLYIASLGGKLVLAFNQHPIQESIDLFLARLFKQRSDLLLNQEYTGMRENRPETTDFFLYADLFRLKLHLNILLAQLGFKSENKQSVNRPWSPGVRSMGFFHHTDNNTEQFKTFVRFTQNHLYPFQQRIYTTPPVRNRIFEEVPADILISLWCNWLEPRLWWQTRIAHGEKEELAAADRISSWIKENTDMSMDEFLGLFGKNFSVHVAGISTAGFFPVPRLCFSIEILDRKKMDKFFQKIIADLPVRRTMVGGVPVISLLAAQGMLQPSYAFFNGYLLLADSKEQIEDILLKKKKPLAEGKEFQAVAIKPEEPANLHFFARTPEVINALQELASWAGTMIAVRDRKTGAMSKLLVDQVISPLLDSFKAYHAIGIRSTTAPSELIIDGTVLRATPKK